MDDTDLRALSFEDALKQLEQLVERIDSDEVELEQAIRAYEQGVRLRDHCERKLNEAQERISKIRIQDGGVEAVPPSNPASDDDVPF